MAQLMLINPRKRRARKSSMSTNPRRRRRVAHKASSHTSRRVRRNPISAHHMRRIHRRRVRRNPISGGGVSAQVMNGLVGGAGAVLVDVVQGFIPMPASLASGYGAYAVKGALGVMLATFGKKLFGHTAVKMGAGAVTVAAYGALKQATAGMLPGSASVAGIGYMSPTPMGEYLTGPGSRMAGVSGMNEYMPESPQYYAQGGFGNY